MSNYRVHTAIGTTDDFLDGAKGWNFRLQIMAEGHLVIWKQPIINSVKATIAAAYPFGSYIKVTDVNFD